MHYVTAKGILSAHNFICHRQRSVFWPKAGALLCSQDAANTC